VDTVGALGSGKYFRSSVSVCEESTAIDDPPGTVASADTPGSETHAFTRL
jgi:hypothetical protein